MARNSVGSLVVTLGLDAGQYVQGLTKAEYQARTATDRIKKQFDGIGKDFARGLAGGLAGLFSVTAVTLWTKSVLDAAEALQDLSEETGSSVENLSRLANVAQIQGTSLDQFRTTIEKFSAKLGGVEEDTGKFAQALKVLGVTARDPATALEQTAKALNKYADDATKAAYARALFDKSGVAFLSTLKAIGQDTQTAATRTAEQARAADELREAMRRLSVESQTFSNILLSSVVPAVSRLIGEFNEGIRIAGGFWKALSLFSTLPTTSNLEETREAIRGVESALADAEKKSGGFFGKLLGGDQAVENFKKQLEFLRSIQKRQLEQAFPSGFDTKERGGLPSLPSLGGDRGSERRAARERESEAERYIKQLERQEEQLQELSVAEQALLDFSLGRIEGATAAQFKEIHAIAQRIDASKAAQKAEEDRKRAAEDAARAEEERNRAASDRLRQFLQEQDSIRASNEQLQLEIALIGKDEEARRALTLAFERSAIAREIDNIAARKAAETDEDARKALETQIELLEQRSRLLGQRDATLKLAEDIQLATQRAQEFNEAIGGPFANALSDAVTGTKSLKDAFNDMTKSIVRNITDIASRDLANALFGGVGTKNAGSMSGIGEWLAGLFRGGGGGFGDMPPMLDFNANGTNFARGGWSVVGERGPEVVNLPRGAQVIPNSTLNAKRVERSAPIIINQSFAPGTDRRTVGQAAAAAGKAVRRGMERYA